MRLKKNLLQELLFATLLVGPLIDRGLHLAYSWQISRPHQNQLCLGECYNQKRSQRKEIEVDWELSTDLDHSTKQDVYNLRTRRVDERPELLKGPYIPSKTIFGLLVDNLKWWGFDGYYKSIRSGDRANLSSAGKSLRGEEILNPFYLISAKILTYTVNNPMFQWRNSAFPSPERGNCPFWPEKSPVKWVAGERKAEVTYYVSQFIDKLETSNCLAGSVKAHRLDIHIDPVNAQDFGLLFLGFSQKESLNISFDRIKKNIFRLNFFYHRGTSCGHPDGCNNISPLVKEFQQINTTALPARLVIMLWEKEPDSASDEPDFRYVMNFE